MKPSDKNTTQVMTILEKLNTGEYLGQGGAETALAAIQQLINSALPEKATYPADPNDLTEPVETAIVAHNAVLAKIRNNLKKVGLL